MAIAKSNLSKLFSEVLLLPDEELLVFLFKEFEVGVVVLFSSLAVNVSEEVLVVVSSKAEEVEVSKFGSAVDVSESILFFVVSVESFFEEDSSVSLFLL